MANRTLIGLTENTKATAGTETEMPNFGPCAIGGHGRSSRGTWQISSVNFN